MNRKQRRKMMTTPTSICSEHGPYDKHNLCPCYDPGGPKADQRDTYGTKAWAKNIKWETPTNDAGEQIGFCPIHGETTINSKGIFQCGCFDEQGNKIVHLTDNPNDTELF